MEVNQERSRLTRNTKADTCRIYLQVPYIATEGDGAGEIPPWLCLEKVLPFDQLVVGQQLIWCQADSPGFVEVMAKLAEIDMAQLPTLIWWVVVVKPLRHFLDAWSLRLWVARRLELWWRLPDANDRLLRRFAGEVPKL